ncbi:tyrosine-type recombinase/integrase [soil metagenome]
MSNRIKITKQLIQQARANRPSKGASFFRDSSLIGFGLKVSQSSLKYIVERKVGKDGPVRRVEVGSADYMPLEQARIEAQRRLADLADGIDPSITAKKKPDAPTLKQALEDMLADRPYRENTKKQHHQRVNYAFRDWLDFPLTQITEALLSERHKEIAWSMGSRKANSRTNGLCQARCCITTLSTIFNFAKYRYRSASGDRLITENPCKFLSETRSLQKTPTRRDYCPPSQMQFLYDAVLEVSRPELRAYFLFLVLTGFRKMEAKQLRWDEVDERSRLISLPNERVKTGTGRAIPITTQLQEILIAMRHQQRLGIQSDFVFKSPDYGKPVSDVVIYPTFSRIRESSGVKDLKIHGLRRSYITHGSGLCSERFQKKLVGHAADITGLYDCSTVDDLREGAQAIADHIEKLLTSGGKITAAHILAPPPSRLNHIASA